MKSKLLYILALILTVELCVSLELDKQHEAAQTAKLQQSIITLTDENNAAQGQIEGLQMELERKEAEKTDRGGERGTMRIMEVTAYDLSYQSCGKLPNHPEYGITASGERVKEWYTVATGPKLPFGTKIYIPYFAEMPNNGVFTVCDRGGLIKDGCIDVYMEDYASCMEFGRRELEVWIME